MILITLSQCVGRKCPLSFPTSPFNDNTAITITSIFCCDIKSTLMGVLPVEVYDYPLDISLFLLVQQIQMLSCCFLRSRGAGHACFSLIVNLNVLFKADVYNTD